MSRLLLPLAALPLLASCHHNTPDPDPQPTEVLAPPSVLQFYPRAAAAGATVTLLGNNFSQTPANNRVKFTVGEAQAFEMRKGTRLDTLRVTVPPNAASGPLTLSVYQQTTTTTAPFTLVAGRWTRKANFAGGAGMYGTGFSLAGKLYVVAPGSHELWAYDPGLNTWTRKASSPVGTIALSSRQGELLSFVVGNYAYVGVYLYDYPVDEIRFYRYDPATDQWSNRSVVPRINAHHAAVFGLGTKGYLVGTDSYDKRVREYDPQTNTWTIKGSFPGTERYLSTYFSLNDKGYLGGGETGTTSGTLRDFWEYSPATDSWTRKADLLAGNFEPNGFATGGLGYMMSTDNLLFAYNPQTNTWAREADFPGSTFTGKVYISGPDKGYVVRGRDVFNGVYPDFWEFSPR